MRIFVLALTLTGCVVALPGTRTEVGRSWSAAGRAQSRIGVGTFVGSHVPNSDTRIEAGAGLFYEAKSNDEGDPMPEPSERGAHADVGLTVLRTSFARAIVGLRYERYWGGLTKFAGKARLDLELVGFGSGDFRDSDSCSAAAGSHYGNMGLGVYAEAGRAWMMDDRSGWAATVGLTVRLPAFAAIVISTCHSHVGGGRSHGVSGPSGSKPS